MGIYIEFTLPFGDGTVIDMTGDGSVRHVLRVPPGVAVALLLTY